MLSIGRLEATRGASYYLAKVANSIDDYYLGRGEAPGCWLGKGAAELSLSGVVSSEELAAVLDGVHPADGVTLLSYHHPRRRPGFDLCFSAPKSVSLLWAFGEARLASLLGSDHPAISSLVDPSQRLSSFVQRAHDEAVSETIGFLQSQACWVRRGGTGGQVEAGGGFIAASFRHRTSRALDPQLHTHVLLANLARGPDSRYSALDARQIYSWQKAAGTLYQSALRANLSPLGIAWDVKANGLCEIAGLDKGILRHFSRRRSQIEETMEAVGARSAKGAEIAALSSRRAKHSPVCEDVLRAMWKSELSGLVRHDGTERREVGVADITGCVGTHLSVRANAEEIRARFDVLVDRHHPPDPVEWCRPEEVGSHIRRPGLEVVSSLTQHSSTFTYRDAISALGRLWDGTPDELAHLADELLGRDEVIEVLADKPPFKETGAHTTCHSITLPGERRYTTCDMVAVEKRLVASGVSGLGAQQAVVAPSLVDAVLADHPTLDGEQAEAVRKLCTSGNRLDVVVGPAGCGKTFIFSAARSIWTRAGYSVIGCALSARAAAALESGSGIASSTIHLLLSDLQRHGGLDGRSVIVVDEAAMAGSRLLERLRAHVEEAGAKWVWSGDFGQLPEIDAGGAFRGVADALGETTITLSTNRRQVESWERQALAHLASGCVEAALSTYETHGRIVFAETAPQACAALIEDWYRHSSMGSVIIAASRRCDVSLLNDLARLKRAQAGELGEQLVTASGKRFSLLDRVVAEKNAYNIHPALRNGEFGIISAIRADASLMVNFDSGVRVDVPADYVDAHLALGYAATLHKAQGATADYAFILGSDALYRQAAYTGLSRGRYSNTLYWVAPDGPDHHVDHEDAVGKESSESRDALIEALSKSRAQSMAMEYRRAAVPPMDFSLAQSMRQWGEIRAAMESREANPSSSMDDSVRDPRRLAVLEKVVERYEACLAVAASFERNGYIRGVLGPVPQLPSEQRAWRRAAGAIEGYRLRWNIDDATALDLLPDGPVRAADHRRAEAAIAAYGFQVDRSRSTTDESREEVRVEEKTRVAEGQMSPRPRKRTASRFRSIVDESLGRGKEM